MFCFAQVNVVEGHGPSNPDIGTLLVEVSGSKECWCRGDGQITPLDLHLMLITGSHIKSAGPDTLRALNTDKKVNEKKKKQAIGALCVAGGKVQAVNPTVGRKKTCNGINVGSVTQEVRIRYVSEEGMYLLGIYEREEEPEPEFCDLTGDDEGEWLDEAGRKRKAAREEMERKKKRLAVDYVETCDLTSDTEPIWAKEDKPTVPKVELE